MVEGSFSRTPAVENVLPSNGFDLISHCCRRLPIPGHRHKDSFPLGLLPDLSIE